MISDAALPAAAAGRKAQSGRVIGLLGRVMPDTFALIKNRTELRLGQLERALAAEGSARPAWVIGILASVLIFTTVVDVLGNLLVIISVFRNRKLRNAGKIKHGTPPFSRAI